MKLQGDFIMKTIIYAHPYTGSLNHEILNRLSNSFSMHDEEFEVIDPYYDKFNPLLMGENLQTYSTGDTNDELVKRYQRKIAASNELIFIFPIWWQSMPAMLKGFFDKVMLKDFAYNEDHGWKGLLDYIKKVTVITTSTVSKQYLIDDCGDPVQGVFIDRTLADIGIDPKDVNWIHFGEATTTTEANREKFLNELPALYENN